MKNRSGDSVSSSRREFLKTGAGAVVGLAAGAKARGFGGGPSQSGKAAVQPSAPQWVRELIVYEIAPKGFTSPKGPESGTFKSLKGKLPYLQDLGINGIWLAGHALADSHHFFNIWSAYAVIDVGKLDPSLGNPTEFRSLIDEAHRRGIRIFLDVITHGVMDYSPLIREHPHWFRGGTWRMTDYDWYGGHTDLDDWWVQVWSNYVTEYGVDGYRLDTAIYRPDLWERIRQNAAAAGHEIVIFDEVNAPIQGVTDFTQHENNISTPHSPALDQVLLLNVPGFYRRKFGKTGHYKVVIQYDDGSRVEGSTDAPGVLRVRLEGLGKDMVSRTWDDSKPDGIPDIALAVEGVARRPIENIVVTDDETSVAANHQWRLHSTRDSERPLALEGEPPSVKLHVAMLEPGWPSIQLSCHDNHGTRRPGTNPYVAHGSRSIFGYSFLLTPMIPIFFSGEEFNASYRPIPWEDARLYGGKEPGTGTWLYGNMLDWSELKEPPHRAMFEDVKRMIAVRKREAAILILLPDQREPNLMAVSHAADIAVPVPYICWNKHAAILVAGNLDTTRDAHVKMQIPLQAIGLAGHTRYRISDLWPGGESRPFAEEGLANFACMVKRDKVPSGGLQVFKIEPDS